MQNIAFCGKVLLLLKEIVSYTLFLWLCGYFILQDVERGQVFNNRYSPFGSSSNWLGLHKAGNDFAGYIAVSSLLRELL